MPPPLKRMRLEMEQEDMAHHSSTSDYEINVEPSFLEPDETSGDKNLSLLFSLVNGNCNISTVKNLLSKGSDPNCKTFDLRTPLHYAAGNKHCSIEIIQELLKYGADVNAEDKNQVTPLYDALKYNCNIDLIKMLIKNGADVNRKDVFGGTSFHCAVSNQHCTVQVLKELIHFGAEPNVIDEHERNLLHYAAIARCEIDVFKELIAYKMNPNAVDKYGMTAVHYLVCTVREVEGSGLQYFSTKDFKNCRKENWISDLREIDNNIKLARQYKVKQGLDIDILKFLIENGADVEVKDDSSRNLLHYAAMNSFSSTDVVDVLLNVGLSLNTIDNTFGKTPLLCAIENENFDLDMIIKLLSCGADPNICDMKKDSPFHYAIHYKNCSAIKELLKAGGNPNAINSLGMSFLHFIAKDLNFNLAILNEVLAYEPKINLIDSTGNTPISYAVKNKNCEADAIKSLLKSGANARFVERETGKTLLHIALGRSNLKTDIIRELVNYKVDPNESDVRKETPLHYASKLEDINIYTIIKELLKLGANPNALDINRKTPLHNAACKGILDNVIILLKYHSNPSAVDETNYSPLTYAISHDNHMKISDRCQIHSTRVVEELLMARANLNGMNVSSYTPFGISLEINSQTTEAIIYKLNKNIANGVSITSDVILTVPLLLIKHALLFMSPRIAQDFLQQTYSPFSMYESFITMCQKEINQMEATTLFQNHSLHFLLTSLTIQDLRTCENLQKMFNAEIIVKDVIESIISALKHKYFPIYMNVIAHKINRQALFSYARQEDLLLSSNINYSVVLNCSSSKAVYAFLPNIDILHTFMVLKPAL